MSSIAGSLFTSMEIDHEDDHFSSASPVRVERRGYIRVRLRRKDILRPAGEVVALAERTRPKPAAGDPIRRPRINDKSTSPPVMATVMVTLLSSAAAQGGPLQSNMALSPGITAQGVGGETLADCMGFWDRGTHMSKAAWKAACLRTMKGYI
jgi:hypothetical protein